MKTIKLLNMAMLCMSIALVSCSGSDGETGPQGEQGPAGKDGIDGVDGTDGTDGNANVNDYDFLITEFSGTDFTVNLIEDSAFEGDMDSFAFLYYLRDINGLWVSAPGPIFNNYYTSVFVDESTLDITVSFYNSDNTIWNVPEGIVFSKFRVVAIEYSGQGNKSAQESVISELKATGVDTSDYNAVAEYFGLE